MANIKVPSYVKRPPRSLDDLKHWKGLCGVISIFRRFVRNIFSAFITFVERLLQVTHKFSVCE